MAEGLEVRTAMRQAADALAGVPAYAWPACLVFILRRLEPKAEPGEYQVALKTLAQHVACRLEAGHW